MDKVKTLWELLKVILTVYQYIQAKITEAVLMERLRGIRESALGASTGTLKERLEHVKDIEDNYNSDSNNST